MKVVWAALIIVGAAGVAITAMLLVRRNAPDGGYFNDGDRAAGVFGVLATGFSVLLGFIVFLAFETYDGARAGAEEEALTVAQQVQTAQFLPAEAAGELTGELICYARSVVHVEWPQMEAGTPGRADQPLGGGDVPDPQDRAAGDGQRGGRLRQVARPDLGPGAGAHRPCPWRASGWSLRRCGSMLFFSFGHHRRVHAVLRRQR